MPRFRFNLEPLLRARTIAERARQRAVADVERERLRLEGLLRRQQNHIDEGRSEMRSRLVGTVHVHELRGQAAASMKQMSQAQRIVLELAAVHKRLDAVRSELLKAAQARRAIELLRDRRYEEWKKDQSRAESAALDELAAQRVPREFAP